MPGRSDPRCDGGRTAKCSYLFAAKASSTPRRSFSSSGLHAPPSFCRASHTTGIGRSAKCFRNFVHSSRVSRTSSTVASTQKAVAAPAADPCSSWKSSCKYAEKKSRSRGYWAAANATFLFSVSRFNRVPPDMWSEHKIPLLRPLSTRSQHACTVTTATLRASCCGRSPARHRNAERD